MDSIVEQFEKIGTVVGAIVSTLELLKWIFAFASLGGLAWFVKLKVHAGSSGNLIPVSGRYRAVINPDYELDCQRGGIFPAAPNIHGLFESTPWKLISINIGRRPKTYDKRSTLSDNRRRIIRLLKQKLKRRK